MDGSWPRVWEPQAAVNGFPAKCGRSTTPSSMGTRKILASLSAQQEKLRELESRLRLWPSRPKDAGSVAAFLEEVAARIDTLGLRLQAMDDQQFIRGRSPRKSYGSDIARLSDSGRAQSVASEPVDRGLRTYPSWPEKAESAWRQLAASWQEMASRAEVGGRPPSLVRPPPHVAHVAHVARQEPSMGSTSMSASFAAVGQKAPQPRDVSFSYHGPPSQIATWREEPQLRASVASGHSEGLDEARQARVFQSTPSRSTRPPMGWYQGVREPVTASVLGVSKEYPRSDRPAMDLLEPNSAPKPNAPNVLNGSSGRRQGRLILAEPEFDPNGHQWAK